jgi:sugar/nucleoside kinase (ribokinase family)
MKKDFDILVAGEINPDLILSGDIEPAFGQVEKIIESSVLTIGSSSAIFACGAARLGLKVAFIGMCGEDIFGHFMLDELTKNKVNVQNVIIQKDRSTGLSVILNRGTDRAILTLPGLIPALKEEDIPSELLHRCRHLHVASYFLQKNLQPGLPQLFSRAHACEMTTSLDTNYDPSEKWLGLDELLAGVDIFLPNETEACSITKAENADLAGEILKNKVPMLAIKRGSKGALGFQGEQKINLPARPTPVTDTVGAGDSFDAGFIYGCLQGWPLEKSLKTAVICGSFSTRGMGGTSTQATLDEVIHELS